MAKLPAREHGHFPKELGLAPASWGSGGAAGGAERRGWGLPLQTQGAPIGLQGWSELSQAGWELGTGAPVNQHTPLVAMTGSARDGQALPLGAWRLARCLSQAPAGLCLSQLELCNKALPTGWLKRQALLSHGPGSWMPEIRAQGRTSWLADSHLSVCPHATFLLHARGTGASPPVCPLRRKRIPSE